MAAEGSWSAPDHGCELTGAERRLAMPVEFWTGSMEVGALDMAFMEVVAPIL